MQDQKFQQEFTRRLNEALKDFNAAVMQHNSHEEREKAFQRWIAEDRSRLKLGSKSQ
tara:strand:+ start:397 stop:567 length:171 start_codon:yes stop_codon:yes gene_type:complete